MQHPDEGTIHAWLDGALPGDERAAIETHVRQCAECAAAAAEARGMIAGATRILSTLDDAPLRAGPASGAPVAWSARGQRSAWHALRLTPLRAVLAASLMVVAASALAIRHAGTGAGGAPAADSSAAPLLSQVPSSAAVSTPAPVALDPGESRPAAKKAVSSPAATRPPVSVASADAAGRDVSVPVPSSVPHPVRASDSGTVGRVAALMPDSAPPRPTAAAGVAMLDSRRAMMRSAVTRRERAPVAAAESATSLAGCYQLLRDSLDPSSPMPDRFVLEGAASDADADAATARTASNRVRALTADGRPGRVIETASWRPTGPATALVSWRERSVQAVLSLERAGGEIVARLAFGAGAQQVRVISLPCNR